MKVIERRVLELIRMLSHGQCPKSFTTVSCDANGGIHDVKVAKRGILGNGRRAGKRWFPSFVYLSHRRLVITLSSPLNQMWCIHEGPGARAYPCSALFSSIITSV